MAHDRAIFPEPTHDTKGQPKWKGSKAQELLRKDMERWKNQKVKPKTIYNEREEYYDHYTLDFIRNKFCQEDKFNKRQAWLEAKAAAKAAAKADTKKKT